MMDTKHTPGPWHVSEDSGSTVVDDLGLLVADTSARGKTIYREQADARLIAEALAMATFLRTVANYKAAAWNENAEQQRSAFALSAREILARIDGE